MHYYANSGHHRDVYLRYSIVDAPIENAAYPKGIAALASRMRRWRIGEQHTIQKDTMACLNTSAEIRFQSNDIGTIEDADVQPGVVTLLTRSVQEITRIWHHIGAVRFCKAQGNKHHGQKTHTFTDW